MAHKIVSTAIRGLQAIVRTRRRCHWDFLGASPCLKAVAYIRASAAPYSSLSICLMTPFNPAFRRARAGSMQRTQETKSGGFSQQEEEKAVLVPGGKSNSESRGDSETKSPLAGDTETKEPPRPPLKVDLHAELNAIPEEDPSKEMESREMMRVFVSNPSSQPHRGGSHKNLIVGLKQATSPIPDIASPLTGTISQHVRLEKRGQSAEVQSMLRPMP